MINLPSTLALPAGEYGRARTEACHSHRFLINIARVLEPWRLIRTMRKSCTRVREKATCAIRFPLEMVCTNQQMVVPTGKRPDLTARSTSPRSCLIQPTAKLCLWRCLALSGTAVNTGDCINQV